MCLIIIKPINLFFLSRNPSQFPTKANRAVTLSEMTPYIILRNTEDKKHNVLPQAQMLLKSAWKDRTQTYT